MFLDVVQKILSIKLPERYNYGAENATNNMQARMKEFLTEHLEDDMEHKKIIPELRPFIGRYEIEQDKNIIGGRVKQELIILLRVMCADYYAQAERKRNYFFYEINADKLKTHRNEFETFQTLAGLYDKLIKIIRECFITEDCTIKEYTEDEPKQEIYETYTNYINKVKNRKFRRIKMTKYIRKFFNDNGYGEEFDKIINHSGYKCVVDAQQTDRQKYKLVITNNALSFLGMSSFCSWHSCQTLMTNFFGYAIGIWSNIANPNSLIAYVTNEVEIGMKGLEEVKHEQMMYRHIIRVYRARQTNKIKYIMVDRGYPKNEFVNQIYEQLLKIIKESKSELFLTVPSDYNQTQNDTGHFLQETIPINLHAKISSIPMFKFQHYDASGEYYDNGIKRDSRKDRTYSVSIKLKMLKGMIDYVLKKD